MGALVILSGGQDSTICLFQAKQKHEFVHAVTFNYGQRHSIELDSAVRVATMAGVESHHQVTLPNLLGTSPLTDPGRDVGHYDSAEAMPGGLEATFVPGRNLIFLALAANIAAARDCDTMYTGVSQEDFGGYPDCREVFIKAMEFAIMQALPAGKPVSITTPLLHISKAESVRLAQSLPGCMEALAYSHTCYDGMFPPNPTNHASILRAKGFHDAGIADPLIVRAIDEHVLPADYPTSGYVFGTKHAPESTEKA